MTGMPDACPLPGVKILSGLERGIPRGCRLTHTTRRGGVSPPPYDSLNLSHAVGDEPSRVNDNRARLAANLEMSAQHLTFAAQAHGLHLQEVGKTGRGRGHASREDAFPATDALMTKEPDTPLVIMMADCYAVAVMGEGCIAIAHAGWRGTLGDIAGICVRAMGEQGYAPRELYAYLGPGIRDCCYTVDEGRAAAFVERYDEDSVVSERTYEGHRLNLELANILNLRRAGLRPDRIVSHGGCTACDPEYFSYRRDGLTGRQGMIVWMSEGSG